ncbi:MarR family transcriptional regulator [Thermosporothrix hazakensis]|jgi:DNA-binding MarR family transcriptional regulator|uniref:MarR family transcriptional regulator n=1 Tax=Thermosporothrix hazakensis TaxID=644383 RepID=A0A326UQH3_THEHA|nr:MarR family transcriptional regulator [Thermosporothrix hazakensis]PZW32747.1 MarR family transcriptional regulator [Thermosporothrix hazakensis]GCE50105.1 MarR family transcriptional regulator [Thermosporothrix hazakensis]
MSLEEHDGHKELDIYQQLVRAYVLLDDSDSRFFSDYGLSPRQFWTLSHLDEKEGHSMIDLSRLILTDKSNMTGIIDRLEKIKLVKRQPMVQDRRVTLITLTPKGKKLRDEIEQQHRLRIRELIGVLPPERQGFFLECLETIAQHVEEYLANTPAKT